MKYTKPLFLTPHTTIIVFDIHGVLFKDDYWQMIKLFFAMPYAYRCLWYGLYPSVWLDYFRLRKQGIIFEKRVFYFIEKYPALKPCLPLIMAVANAQKPDSRVVRIVQKLHAARYELHVLSNIGPMFGADLIKRFPAVFQYFTVIKTPTEIDDYRSKRHSQFFKNYLKEYNKQGKVVVFIDDTQANVQAAQDCGMVGVRCRDTAQLAAELMSLGIGLFE